MCRKTFSFSTIYDDFKGKVEKSKRGGVIFWLGRIKIIYKNCITFLKMLSAYM
jgi:hypothetical protein